MLSVTYRKTIPYPPDVVLAQYWDYEHITHVHPETLGEYRVLEAFAEGVVYEQLWPADRRARRARSVVRQTAVSPSEIEFEFVEGRHRGVRLHTRLEAAGGGTRIEETYHLHLPNWAWLRPLVLAAMRPTIERVWDEDLAVGVCIGGWPGVPGGGVPPAGEHAGSPSAADVSADLPLGRPVAVMRDGEECVAVRVPDGVCVLSGRCPHAGAPLALGAVRDGCLICPWHGAAFDLETGAVRSGPAAVGLRVYLRPEATTTRA